MTVFDTLALSATASTENSGPEARTASTAAATSSSRRARRCSVQRERRPSGDGAVWGAPGFSTTRCMCFTVTATFRENPYSTTRGELTDDRNAAEHRARSAAGEEARRPPGVVFAPARFGREEVLRPRRGHRLGRTDP